MEDATPASARSSLLSALLKARFTILDLVLVLSVSTGAILYVAQREYDKIFNAAFQSPLPKFEVAEPGPADAQVFSKPYEFTGDFFSPQIPIWQNVLEPFKGKPGVHYLEVGVYEGRSALWMLENILTDSSARLTAVDIFAGPYKEKYHANIKRSGVADKVTTMAEASQTALRKLPLESFDIIYIDGSHAKEDVLEDAVLSYRLLKPGGILIFDDYLYAGFFAPAESSDRPTDFPKNAIDPFVKCFEKHLTVVHNSYQLILRKKAATPDK